MSKIYAVQGDSLPLVTLTFLWPRIMLRTMMGV